MTATDSLELGQQALRRGAWDEARVCFAEAAAMNEAPEALEGLSWAAWWLDDAATLFAARERALQLYQARKDLRGAARMALWLSSDYMDFRGEAAIANGWRRRARRMLGGLEVSPEHGWLAVLEGDLALLVEDDAAGAGRWAQEAVEVGRQVDSTDLAMLGLAMEGIALVSQGRVHEGLDRLDEAAAAALAGELKETYSITWILCYLIYACERVRDYERAGQWCEKMREFASRFQSQFGMGVCRAHYGSVLVWRGKWHEAEAELAAATGDLMASRPAWAPEGAVRLAELRRRQGHLDEAERILHEAEWHPLAILGLAEIALDRDNPAEAEELAARMLRQVPVDTKMQRVGALELLVRARAAAGDGDGAAEALLSLQAIADEVKTLPLRGAASCAAGIVARVAGDYEEARRQLEDALILFERAGAPYEAACARLELAQALLIADRHGVAGDHGKAAQEAFDALGAAGKARQAAALVSRLSPVRVAEAGSLTPRELEVLRLVAKGLSDREIAAALFLSEHTVHRHIANVLTKTDTPSRAAAVAHAARHNFLE